MGRWIACNWAAVTCPLAIGIPAEAKKLQDFQIVPIAQQIPGTYLESVLIITVCPFVSVKMPVRAMGLVAWTDFTINKVYVSSGEIMAQLVMETSYGITVWQFHLQETSQNKSLGCLRRCLRDPLVALRSFLQFQGNQVEWSWALCHQERVWGWLDLKRYNNIRCWRAWLARPFCR